MMGWGGGGAQGVEGGLTSQCPLWLAGSISEALTVTHTNIHIHTYTRTQIRAQWKSHLNTIPWSFAVLFFRGLWWVNGSGCGTLFISD